MTSSRHGKNLLREKILPQHGGLNDKVREYEDKLGLAHQKADGVDETSDVARHITDYEIVKNKHDKASEEYQCVRRGICTESLDEKVHELDSLRPALRQAEEDLDKAREHARTEINKSVAEYQDALDQTREERDRFVEGQFMASSVGPSFGFIIQPGSGLAIFVILLTISTVIYTLPVLGFPEGYRANSSGR